MSMSSLMMDKSIVGQAGFSTIHSAAVMWENPLMSNVKETLRERLRERLEFMSLTPHALSREIGANAGYVRDLLDPAKTGIPSAERLQRLAAALGTTTDYLIGDATSARQPVSEVSVRADPRSYTPAGQNGIPVHGTAYCDDLAIQGPEGEYLIERIQLEVDHVVRFVKRPSSLWNVRDAYAIDLHGDSMTPVMEQGDTRLVDPRRPPAPGDYVVVQLTNGSDTDIATVLVKRLVRASSAFVELEQFNPKLVFRIARRQVARLHRIVPYSELLY
jgi:transcriptional regulator with XRE-family HTH domain